MLLGSKTHTEGDIRRWKVDYSKWLDNTADIDQAEVESSSVTCTVGNITILGKEVVFFLSGGQRNETLTLDITITDSLGNIKRDTLAFTCVAP
jgi:hypothetical protein